MKLIPLGTNGYFPGNGRHTASYLYINGGDVLLLDAGTGIHRLAEDPDIRDLLNHTDTLHVVLTHYHYDHVMGLFFLAAAYPVGRIVLHAAAPPFVDTDPGEAIHHFFSPTFYSDFERAFDGRAEIRPISEPCFSIGDLPVQVWRNTHPGGSLSLRIDEEFVYATDRAVSPGDEDHVRGARVLLHEVWVTDEEAAECPDHLEKHSSLGQVADLARAAGVSQLMPIHHRPGRTLKTLERMALELSERSGVKVVLPEEGRVYEL